MKSKFTWILTLCLAFFIQFSFAQEKTISGTVTSIVDNMSIPGVNIIVKGSTRSTQTDFDGKYTIKAAAGEILLVSMVGSITQSVVVGTSNVVNIQLQEDSIQLEGVVVEGYGKTSTKAKSNVASTTIGAETIGARPNASFVQTMQSQIAGVDIKTGSGQPGASSYVIIRGIGSLNGKVEPLYVIDGVPQSADNFRSINPEEIESASALLDAGATAIYGNRGANGVIVVKTKRAGFDTPLNISYTSTTGFSTRQGDNYNMMNSQQLLTLERTKGKGAGANGGLPYLTYEDGMVDVVKPNRKPLTDAQINAYSTTDWNDYFFRTGTTVSHNLGLTNGSKNVSTYTNFGYFKQEGILINTDLQRFNFRNNLDGKSDNDKFRYSTNVNVNFSKNNSASDLGTGGINQNYIIGASRGVPYISPDEYINGQQVLDLYNADGTLVYTPLMLVDKTKTFLNNVEEIKAITNFSASYEFIPGLTLTENLGIDYTQTTGLQYQSPAAFNSLVFQQPDQQYVGIDSESYGRDVTFDNTISLDYEKAFGLNTISATIYTEYVNSYLKTFGFTQNGLDPKTTFPGDDAGFITDLPNDDYYVPTVNATIANVALLSYFASANYDYDGKYGLQGTLRRDASSRFSDTNKWGTFYSISGRWNLNREKFMENAGFQLLKLRASYGTTGNQDIDNSYYGALNRSKELYVTGTGYNGAPSYVIGQLANPDLKWETIAMLDIGIDFTTLDNRLTGKFDYYKKVTTDLYQTFDISLINATPGIPANFGSMSNEGFEATLAYDLIRTQNSFNFTIRANGAFNENRVIDIPTASGFIDNGTTVVSEGHMVDEFYAVRYIGVNPASGNLLYLDINGNATENPTVADRVYTGKSAAPRYFGGFGFDADYKGFYITAQFAYAYDNYRFDYDLSGVQSVEDIGTFNRSTDLLRAWTPDNRITDIPSIFLTNSTSDSDSDRYLIDASYTRLRFASFGYDFPREFLKRTPFDQVKAFVQGENLATWSGWRGADAESSRGADQSQYPTPRTISLGFQLKF